MAEKKINTTVSLRETPKPSDEIMAELDRTAKLAGGKLVPILVEDIYLGAFGNPMRFSVNGIPIEIPIGTTVMVPEMHYLHAKRLMAAAVITKRQEFKTPEEVYKI